MQEGEALTAFDVAADPHATAPPPRFTEGSLVKALEERGIGRPSTYAPTLQLLQARFVMTTIQARVCAGTGPDNFRLLEVERRLVEALEECGLGWPSASAPAPAAAAGWGH